MEEPAKRGQVLVLVAISLLVLIAILALAVDIGSIYGGRRKMQNAADAGALAGAREICFGDIGTESAALSTAHDYAVNRNDADGAIITITMPITVTVVATRSVETYFAGVIGFDSVPVSADATAVCGKAGASGGLWPVAFDAARWLGPEEITCEMPLIIWRTDDEDPTDYDPTANRANCDTHNCCTLWSDKNPKKAVELGSLDCNADGEPSMYPLDATAWIDLTAGLVGDDPCDTGTGTGGDEIKYRIDGHNKGEPCIGLVDLPQCFAAAAAQGKVNSGWMAAKDAAGRIVTIPLYDTCQSGKKGGQLTDCPWEPNTVCYICDNPPCDADEENSGGITRYYVTVVACVRIGIQDPIDDELWHATGYLWGIEDDTGFTPPPKEVIVATIPCDEFGGPPAECGTAPGWTSGDLAEPGDPKAVSLVE